MGVVAVGRLSAVAGACLGAAAGACLGAAGLLLGATACGERGEPTGRSVELYPVTVAVDAVQKPLVLQRAARRLAILATPGPAEILVALGAGERVAGFPLAPNGSIRVRELVRLRPDLIVAAPSTNEVELSRAAAAARAPVYIALGSSIRDVERTITQLGAIVGKPVAAGRLVRVIEKTRRLVAKQVAGRPKAKVFVDLGFFTTVPDGSLVGDLIREAGGVNVAGGHPDPGPFDLKELRQLDPDVYVAAADGDITLARLRRNPRTRRLKAVREGRFELIDPSLLEPGSRIGDGLLLLARALHPDAFR